MGKKPASYQLYKGFPGNNVHAFFSASNKTRNMRFDVIHHHQGDEFIALMMEAVHTSETLLYYMALYPRRL
jgi:hypothetical protein